MKRLILAAACAAAGIAGLTVSGTALAHGPRIGVWIGPGPWWWGPPYPYYYYPVQPAPVVVQPPAVTQVPPAPTYWYFCRESNAYYPYVGQCPSGWEQVTPQQSAPAGPYAPPGR